MMRTSVVLVILSTLVLLAGCSMATGQFQPAANVEDENGQGGDIILSNLAVKPVDHSGFCDIKNLEYGEDIIISAEAANPGTAQVSRDITLYVDWKEIEARHILLAPSGNTVVVFELIIDAHPDGMYHVTLDELWSSFGVG